jgi:hypothetical protein
LGDSAELGPGVAPAALGLEVSSIVGTFSTTTGFGVFTGMGKPLVPLGLRGSGDWGAAFVASRLGDLSALGFSFFDGGSFMESGSMSCSTLHQ